MLTTSERLEKKAYVVGSSKNIAGGLLTSSSATDSLFLCPPDNCSTEVERQLSKPSVSNTSSTCNKM